MRFELPELPFDRDALEPHISAETVSVHYDKHHQGYLTKLEKALDGHAGLKDKSLVEIIRHAYGEENAGIFNPAAQVYNHNFYWQSLSPAGARKPSAALGDALQSSFGGLEGFNEAFREKAAGQFGSGWAWLVHDPSADGLRVVSTANAMCPVVLGLEPLLTLDVWEHAYYLDYQHRRADYIDCFLEKLINWDTAERRFNALPMAA
jgi:Fe-Mn family superoxide dismutase